MVGDNQPDWRIGENIGLSPEAVRYKYKTIGFTSKKALYDLIKK